MFKVFDDLNEEDFEEFMDAITARMYSENLGWWDRSFSANDYDSWPTPGRGHTAAEDRLPWRDLPGSKIVESILELMETSGQRGKRFHIKGNTALRSDDDAVICRLLYYRD